MQQFFINNKRSLFIAALLLISLTLFAKGIEQKAKHSFFDRLVLTLFSAPLSLTNKGISATGRAWNHYIYLVGLYEENESLKKRADALAIENQLLRDQADENRRLRELLVFQKKFEHKMLPAEIIGHDPSGWFKTVLVDKGTLDGVTRDAGVITPDGVVGRIIEAGLNSSKVLLITDINSYVDALIKRTRTHGIVVGRGEQACSLSYVLKTEEVAGDDIIVSSGITNVFPRGIPIGTITRLSRDRSGFFQTIEIKPAVDFSKLHEVLIVVREQERQK